MSSRPIPPWSPVSLPPTLEPNALSRDIAKGDELAITPWPDGGVQIRRVRRAARAVVLSLVEWRKGAPRAAAIAARRPLGMLYSESRNTCVNYCSASFHPCSVFMNAKSPLTLVR